MLVVTAQSQLLAQHATDAGGVQLPAVTPVDDSAAVEPFVDLGGLKARDGGEVLKPCCRVEPAGHPRVNPTLSGIRDIARQLAGNVPAVTFVLLAS